MITDFVSPDQFGEAMNEPGAESPSRPTVGHSDKFTADQFQGLVEPDEAEPLKARHPNYINGQSLHAWRTSPEGE